MLVTAVEPLRDDPPLVPSPLMRGFVTFGTDAGHQTDREHDIQVFALNDEALVNHAYAAYKKTHDVALSLLASYYGKRPARVYFIGGSEGGREAMVAAQRFPADYDGVIATVPVLSWTGTNIAEYRQWQAMMDGGWMSAAKVALVQHAVLKACDELDGIEDGVLARYEGCKAEAAIKALRCTDGKDAGDTCLSDKQLALIRIVHEPTRYRSSLAHGEREYAGYPVGGEANPGAYIPTLLPPAQPASDDNGRRNYSVGDVRYFIARDPDFRARLDEKTYAAQISKVSGLMDMNDPDLQAFYARGGKMIIKENGADYLVAPGSVYRYYKNVVKKMGKPTAEKFVRLYVAPWVQHGGQGVAGDGSAVPDKVDLLPVLEGWVEQGKPPADQLVLTSYSKEGLTLRSWPLCRYGEYPHYENNGHPKAAASYTCRSLN
jgi:feruloyl esterase